MAEFNFFFFFWTEPLQISVLRFEQYESTLLVRVLCSRIIPAVDTALGLVLVSLKWCQCTKVRNV